jgi:hypothetical protein
VGRRAITVYFLREKKMVTSRKVHDGVVGAITVLSVGLGYFFSAAWLWIPTLLGLTLLQSSFTGFCPLYFVLDRYLGRLTGGAVCGAESEKGTTNIKMAS